MGEISAASSEQSQGVAQVGEAVTQMDQVTQQNAALVEEMAAAAASLNNQAQDLVSTVAFFKLSPAQAASAFAYVPKAAGPSKALAGSSRPAPVAPSKVPPLRAAAKPAPALASTAPARSGSGNDADWESF
jgi:hypothetical protein